MNKEPKVTRATFEETLNRQHRLLNWLDDLAKQNEPLPEGKRENYLRLVDRALLGQGKKVDLSTIFSGTKINDQKWNAKGLSEGIKIDCVGDFIRALAFVKSKRIRRGTKRKVRTEGEVVDIGQLFFEARDLLVEVMPMAQELSLKISAERIPREETEVHEA